MTPIQLNSGGGTVAEQRRHGLLAVLQPIRCSWRSRAQARLPQCSRGNGSVDGTVFRPTNDAELLGRARQEIAIRAA